MEYLIDTCIISPVTIAELGFGAEMAKDEHVRQKRLTALSRLRKKPFLLIDESTGDVFGRIAASLYRSGRGHDFRVQDLWLASQAIQHGMKLLTKNEKDFFDIPGLDLVIFTSES